MKKVYYLLTIIIIVIGFSEKASAQKFHVGGGFTLTTFSESGWTLGGVFVSGYTRLGKRGEGSTRISYYFPKKIDEIGGDKIRYRIVDMDANFTFDVVQTEKISIYPLVGLNFAYGTLEWNDEKLPVAFTVGLNGGAGVEYHFNEYLSAFLDAKYTWSHNGADDRIGFHLGGKFNLSSLF